MPITVPKSPCITLKANFRAAIFPGKVDQQKVYILVNDKNAGEWTITKRGFQVQKLLIPKSLFTNPNRVIISFSGYAVTSTKHYMLSKRQTLSFKAVGHIVRWLFVDCG